LDLSGVEQSWRPKAGRTIDTIVSSLKSTLAGIMFQEVVSSEVFYSLSQETEMQCLDTVMKVHAPRNEQCGDDDDDAYDFEIDGVGVLPEARPFSPHKFFRLVFKRLAQQKLDKCDTFLGFGSGDMAVTQHLVRKIDMEQETCSVESHPAGLQCGSSGEGLLYVLSGRDLANVFVWQSRGPLCDTNLQLAGCPASCSQCALNRVVVAASG
jgi:hypothetical protein